jgi:hypothetical protein
LQQHYWPTYVARDADVIRRFLTLAPLAVTGLIEPVGWLFDPDDPIEPE